MSEGLAQLQEAVTLLLSKVEALTAKVAQTPRDMTQPFTAAELCQRWGIQSPTDELKLHALAKRCRDWGVKPLQGTRGWEAVYAASAVLRAESYAAGELRSRRAA